MEMGWIINSLVFKLFLSSLLNLSRVTRMKNMASLFQLFSASMTETFAVALLPDIQPPKIEAAQVAVPVYLETI